MARSLFRDTIVLRGPAGLIPLAGAQVWFYEPNGGTPGPPISYPLYPDAHSAVTLPTPYVTGALGELEVWADLPHRAQIVAIKSGYAQVTETIDLEYPPELSATTDDIADAIRIHESEEDPHDQYLTQDEADLAYLKLTGGTVTGALAVNGTLTAYGDASFNRIEHRPITGGSTFVQGSYSESWRVGLKDVDWFLEVGATGALISNHKAVAVSPDAGNTLSWNANGFYSSASATYPDLDNRYEQLSRKGAASGYVPLGADTKIPNAYLPDLAITNTFVVTSEAEMLALVAQTGDVCVRLDTTENYILAAEPATVLANWTKLAASTTAGNTTIVKREEFAPAAAATSVALTAVPTQMLSVSRNGVEQSQPAGHYTVAGVTVTFTDAFVAGERVSVVYEVGSSAPAPINGYTKLESDARYEPIDTMYTKAESDARYLTKALGDTYYQPIGTYLTQTTGDARYLQLTGGTLTGKLTITVPSDFSVNPLETRMVGDANPRFRIDSTGTVRFGDGTAGPDTTLYRLGAGSLATGGHFSPGSSNAQDLGAIGARWRSAYLGTVLSIAGASATANQITHAITTDAQPRLTVDGNGQMKWGPGATTPFDTTLQRTGVGALRVDTHLGVGVNPGAWNASWRAIQVGVGGALMTSNIPQTFLASNSLQETAGWKPIVADKAGVMIGLMETGMFVYTVPAVAAGVTQAPAARMALSPTGTLSLTPAANNYAMMVPNTGWGVRLETQDPRQLEFSHSGYTDVTMRNYQGQLWFYPNNLDPTRAMVLGVDGSLVLHPASGVSGLINYGPARVGGYNAFEGSAVFQVNMASGMEELSSNYVRYGITCNPQMNVVSGATSVTAAALQVGIGGNNRPGGSHMQNAYGAMISGPTISNSGTIAYAAALYLTNSVLGGAVSNQACIWHANTNAQLSNAGSWVNAASWAEGKSDIRYVEGDAVAAIATWFTQGWKPARYRYPAYTEPEIAKASASFGEAPGTKDALTPRPAMQANEYDHFFAILDDMPQEVRDIICVSDTGAISTKDMDGFLAALLQHAMQRIVALEAKLEGKVV